MHVRSALFALVAFTLVAQVAGAQGTTYARTGRDTLRYREVTTTNVRITAPQGEVPGTIEHDATIAVVLLPGDSARAWYEALKLTMTAPNGTLAPETAPVLRQPFVLGFDPRGNITVASTPNFPAGFQSVSDLSLQFSDFFLRLPQSPLTVGLSWTDSTSRTTRKDEKTAIVGSLATYRVERDTTVNGQAAFVISMNQQLRSESEGPMPGQPVRARSASTGTDSGFFVFSRAGEMLGRQRTGTLRGTLTLTTSQGQSMEMGQEFSYTSRIERIR